MSNDSTSLSDKQEYIGLDTARQILHISRKKCAELLISGEIPCVILDRKTRQYRIMLSDVTSYNEKTKAKRYTGQSSMPESFREWLAEEWETVPDVLFPDDIIKLTGYSKSAVNGWISSGKLKHITAQGSVAVAKEWLVEFYVIHSNGIIRKSMTHIELMERYYGEG